MVIVLDLREGAHRKAHAGEHVDDLVGDQGQRVQAAHGAGLGGQGDVHRLGGVAGSQLGSLHLFGGSVVLGLYLGLELVDDLAHGRALFGCDGAQILHQGRDLAVLAEVFLPEGCQRFLAGDLTKALFGLFCQLVDHCLHGCSLLLLLRVHERRHEKKAPSPLPVLRQKGRSCNSLLRGTTRFSALCASSRRHSNAVTGRNRPVLVGRKAVRAGRSGANFSLSARGDPFSR